ncbi:DUF2946 family protein [Limnohabitans sp.]|uniref:DUF2946 family protein n=1 Tax=Limnohabitans sp. TaxID=1907725 RepID=UPI002AFFECCD|nr:DUF2946 family protein [Limnohabitans sp.]
MHRSHPFFHSLSRLVLIWYVLFVGVSVLAATLQPKTMDVVCSAMGIMKVVVQGEGEAPPLTSNMDCPLCAHATPALPPLTAAALAHVPDARAYIVQALPEALLLVRTAPPLPSRGPPDLI